MNFHSFKRWHWACIGLALGLIFSLWRGWVGPEGTLIGRATLESSEFEKLLLAKSPSGQPAVKDIRVHGLIDGTYWLSAQQLFRRETTSGVGGHEEYVAVKIPAKMPYIPSTNPPAKVDPNYTIVDYLKSVKARNPELGFSIRWWAQEPLRTPIFAVVGMLLLGGLCPALVSVLLGPGTGRKDGKEEKSGEYDLSRFGKGKSEESKPVQRGPTEADLSRLRELETELERGLAAKAHANALTETAASESAIHDAASEQPIRKLDAGPLETAIDDKPKPQKRYGGDFYPTETHAKRDET